MVAQIISHPAYSDPLPTPYNPDPVLLAIVQTIREGLIRDQHVRLHNFGTFRLRWSKARRIKHPKTGEDIIAPPAPKITFTPAKQLREGVEPEKMPVIPLHEPASPEAETEQANDSAKSPRTPCEESAEYNLRETVQDILDEEYIRAADNKHAVNATVEHQNDEPVAHKFNKKLGLGLLASVPLILAILQADFSADPPNRNATSNAVESSVSQQEMAHDAAQGNHVFRSEVTETILTQENTREGTQPKQTNPDIASARPEPSPKSFYMSPQLHTIEQGDNFWRLAEEFYGDALLWPHIFRANARTISDPDSITIGRQLVIPGLQQSPDALSNNDKELISEGYFMAYQFNKAKQSPQAIYFLIGATQYSFGWLTKKEDEIAVEDWNIIKKQRRKIY